MPVDPSPKTDELLELLTLAGEILGDEGLLHISHGCHEAIDRIEALEAALSRARAEAFEEAARVADSLRGKELDGEMTWRQGYSFGLWAASRAIRSLATKGDQARPGTQTPAEGGTRDDQPAI